MVYNGATYLRETIESVLGQDFKDFVLLIQDDASNDESLEIIQSYAARDSRIQFGRNESNNGIGYNFQRLMQKANSEYVAQIGHDDLWRPDFLSRMVKVLNQNAQTSAVFCANGYIDGEGDPISGPGLFRQSEIQKQSSHDLFAQLFKGNFLCAAGSLFRRKALGASLQGERLDYLQDWACWLHLLLEGPFQYVEEPLVQYRVHGQNYSLNIRAPRQQRVEFGRIRLGILASPRWPQFLDKAVQPEAFFHDIVAMFIDSPNWGSSERYTMLLMALRRNEMNLLGHDAFRQLLRLLLWAEGCFSESLRYGSFEQAQKQWPELNSLWGKKRILLISKKMRPHLSCVSVPFRRDHLACWIPIISTTESLEKTMEKVFNLSNQGIAGLFERVFRRVTFLMRTCLAGKGSRS